LDIDFSAVGDLLSIWAKGPSKGGAHYVTLKPHLDTFYLDADATEKICVGIYWFDACRILLPVLERGDMSEVEKYPELLVDYHPDTDVLVFGNREECVRSEDMAENLTAHIGQDGLVNRFTLENASVTLLYHFRNPIDKDDRETTKTGAPGVSA
jgi:uncharacterized protein YuzE